MSNNSAYGNSLTINSQYGEQYKERQLKVGTTEWVAIVKIAYNEKQTQTIEITCPYSNGNKDSNIVNWFRTIQETYPAAKLAQKAQAVVYTHYDEADLSTVGCPCTIHRHGINQKKVLGACKAFRPQDVVNGSWRAELTDLKLDGSPSKNRAEYDSKVILALAKHDAANGGFEASVAKQKQLNIDAQIDRTVANEIKKLEAVDGDHTQAFGSASSTFSFGDMANCEVESAVGAFDSNWGTVHIPRRNGFTLFDLSTTSSEPMKRADMKWVIVAVDGSAAYYTRTKKEALQCFHKCLLLDPNTQPAYGTVEAQS